MRLFIALTPGERMRDALVGLQREFARRGVGGSFTRRENLHLTLAFIGEYGDPEAVRRVMEGVPFEPFALALEGVGAFGDLFWAGLAPCGALERYVARLRRALAGAGIPFDRKRFSPHFTLVRGAGGARIPPVAPLRAECETGFVSLFRSDRGKSGMIYTELARAECPRKNGGPGEDRGRTAVPRR